VIHGASTQTTEPKAGARTIDGRAHLNLERRDRGTTRGRVGRSDRSRLRRALAVRERARNRLECRGPLRFTTEWEGQIFEQWGTVLSFDEPTSLHYSLFAPRPDVADVPENYFTMTYELKPDGDVTTVTITQADPRVSDQPDSGVEDDDAEIDPVLLAFKDVAESIGSD